MGILARLLKGTPKKQPVSVNDRNFHAEVMTSKEPVVLDFWSETCPPCKQLEPIMMTLAAEFDGKVKVAECNVNTAPKICARFGIMSTPTILYIKNGEVVDRVSGFRGSLFHREVIEHELLAEA
ncbi:MAG: thioredoxin family protein [Myxococcales bacterium]|nr:thioredoxin family protein [Myxococcales bacterium]